MQDKNAKIIKKNSRIGDRVRKVREDMGLSQSELAKKLGFTKPAVVSRFERNKRLPSTDTLVRLATLCEVDLHWLLTGNPSPTTKQNAKTYRCSIERLASLVKSYMALLHTTEESLQVETPIQHPDGRVGYKVAVTKESVEKMKERHKLSRDYLTAMTELAEVMRFLESQEES